MERGLVLPLDSINFIIEPKDTLVPRNGIEKVKCNVNQINVKYDWLIYNEGSRSEQPVMATPYISMDKSGIIIVRNNPSVVGRYRCKAIVRNFGTVLSRLFRIDVADMHINKLTQRQLGSGKYKIGSRAVLICPFWTVPQSESEYRWYKKEQNGRRQIKMSKTSLLHHNGKMLEIEVDANSFGSYFCEAIYNKYGLERTSPDIDIFSSRNIYDPETDDHLTWVAKPIESLLLDREMIDSKQMRVTGSKGILIIREASPKLELLCAASSESGEVNVVWLKDQMAIDKVARSVSRFQFEIVGQGTLVLTNITEHYSGEYSCTATIPKKTKLIQTSVKVIVRQNLRFTIKPASIVIGDMNKEILLSCRLNDGNSGTRITWRKNGEMISSNSYLQQDDGFMRISRLLDSDEGIFQCIADNEFSSLQAAVHMKIYKAKSGTIEDHRPLPVRNLRVKSTSYRTLNISWSHANGDFETILHYEVILIDLSNVSSIDKKITLKADRQESSILVNGLIPDSFFRIFVSAVNGSGTSYPAIIKSSPRVLSKPSSAVPTKVFVTHVGSGVVKVHWTAPTWNRIDGELLGYRIVISGIDGTHINSLDVAKDSQSLQLFHLMSDTKYFVRLQVLTRGGQGPLSDTITFDTNRVDNKYDANVRLMDMQSLTKSDVASFQNASHLQQPGEISKWRVKGYNTSIALQWSHPYSGGQIKRYKIKWGNVYPGPNEVVLQYPSSSYVIENLEMQTQYMIKITPVNDVGDGKELLFSQFTGRFYIKKIPIPLNLDLKSIGLNSAVISWEDPSNDLSNTRLYQVRYNIFNKDSIISSVRNSTENRVQLIGLLSSTSYEYSVRTGDIIPSSEDDYTYKEWTWSEWSLKETFRTVGEKPKQSPQHFSIETIGKPEVKNSEVSTKVLLSWSLPHDKSIGKYDEILGYIIFFTETPKIKHDKWFTKILPKDQFSSIVSLSGKEKIYYFRIGCRTTNFQCPLSRILIYKTADAYGQNYGILSIPKEYFYSLDIPAKYINANPINSEQSINKNVKDLSRDVVWLIVGAIIGGLVLLMMLLIIIYIYSKRKYKTYFTGYKLGMNSSRHRAGGVELLVSNQSPAFSNGKVAPHFTDQDNDSVHFASVSQNHLSSVSTCTNMFNLNIQNHSLTRRHAKMAYYSKMAPHAHGSIDSPALINSIINVNNRSIINESPNSNFQIMQQHNVIYPFTTHLFAPMPINSSCIQPIHLSPQMLAMQPHDGNNTNNYSNTPRVNASEIVSHASSEDIRQQMNRIKVSGDVSHYGSTAKSAVKFHKSNVDNCSKIINMDSQRSCDVSKVAYDRQSAENDATKGFCTEELSLEMANLEGLMKDLSVITQKEFEC